nr:hypothetical protein Iba_chr13aCG6030 [Ipomoea batatas]
MASHYVALFSDMSIITFINFEFKWFLIAPLFNKNSSILQLPQTIFQEINSRFILREAFGGTPFSSAVAGLPISPNASTKIKWILPTFTFPEKLLLDPSLPKRLLLPNLENWVLVRNIIGDHVIGNVVAGHREVEIVIHDRSLNAVESREEMEIRIHIPEREERMRSVSMVNCLECSMSIE